MMMTTTRCAAATAIAMMTGVSFAGNQMANGTNGFSVSEPLLTIGETRFGYTPVGVLDGLGAFELNADTVRVISNHELLNFRGNAWEVEAAGGGTFSLIGARLSFFDISKTTYELVDAGLAIERIYDATGAQAADASFLANNFSGLSRFCSSTLIEAQQFGNGRGLEDRMYFTGEEDGGFFNGVGGAEWGLDVATGDFWQLPDLGRGAWENVAEVDTGTTDRVAILLADDSSPFDFDPANADGPEAAPLYLYVGEKDPAGDFVARNGLRNGTLYVWVADNGDTRPSQFNGTGNSRTGTWVEVDNTPTGPASEFGDTGFDEFGYPTQGTLWLRAEALGSFGFSRPEDVATNPADGTQVVLASTGVDSYDVVNGVGSDTWGTVYLIDNDFTDVNNPTATITVIYDGNEDLSRALRSPDNLDWADNGLIYIQEDEAEESSLDGEPLFGPGATNQNEASIVELDPTTNAVRTVAIIDRSVVLDGSLANPSDAVDVDAGFSGEWESSGIIDVSTLFGKNVGTLFLFNVQAHGIEDQDDFNPTSRINDGDLVEGGQLLFLSFCPADCEPVNPDGTVGNGVVNIDDLLATINEFGATNSRCDVAPVGPNNTFGNATVNMDDVLSILNNFGGCFGLE